MHTKCALTLSQRGVVCLTDDNGIVTKAPVYTYQPKEFYKHIPQFIPNI
jgi:hypothetical protein